METARGDTIRTHGPRTLRGHMVVRHASCDYDGEIPGGTRGIDVTVSVEKIGTSSFTLLHELRVGDVLVGRGRAVMVALDDARRPRPLSEDERAALQD